MKISLEKVTKRYGEKIIFDTVSLSIQDNEMVAITGKSGSGKSTLLNMLGLLEPFGRGTLRINQYVDPPINSYTAMKLRRNVIGYLFQNFALADNLTVQQNLKLAMAYQKAPKKQETIEEALAQVSLPQNIIHQKVYQLSGGEQQRVAIARLLLKPCDIILADEPTGSLDTENRDLIIELLHFLNKQGKTIIVVTHDPAVAISCTQRLVIAEGNIIKEC